MIAFSIGTINIYRYGIFYAISFLLWYVFLKYQASKRIPSKYPKIKDILKNDTETLIIYLILWVLIWGRVGHILIYDFQYYLSNPLEIFEIRKGWMSFIGWIIWVCLSLWIFKTKNKISNTELLFLFDWILVITPIWIALGRVGNFLNQELYWIAIPNRILEHTKISNLLQQLHIFHVYDKVDNLLRINTNFISSFLEWLVLFIITISVFYFKKEKKTWFISGIFLLYYSMIRFILEYIRYDSQSEFIWYFTKSQRFFLVFIIIWIIILLKASKSDNHISW